VKLGHKTLILICGLTWLGIGIFLLALGLHFILETVRDPALCTLAGRFSISRIMASFIADKTQAAMFVIILSLSIGYIKGRTALAKAAKRQMKRVATLPNPSSLKHLYGKGYYLLIASMILLGICLRYLPITLDTRGAIDTVIGSALINGAMLYFRSLSQYETLRKKI
jgi:hypothetical protein